MIGRMKKKLLLVEDELILALTEAKTLESFGYEVLTTHKAELAITMVQNDPDIALILMDIELQNETDGIETAQKILQIRQLPIIFLTQHSEEKYLSQTDEVPHYGLVIKSSGRHVVHHAIETALNLFHTQATLLKSREQYRLVTDNAKDLIVQVDSELTPVYVSPSAEKILGYTIEDYTNQNVLDFIHPDDRDDLEEELKKRLNRRASSFRHTHRVIAKDHSIHWLETSATILYNQNGQFAGATYVDRDITDRKQLQQLNEEQHMHLKAVLEATPSAIITLDQNNTIDHWNPGAEKLFGFSKEEAQGTDPDTLLNKVQDTDGPTIDDEVIRFNQHVRKGRKLPPTETIRFTKNGTPVHVIVAAAPIFVEDSFKGIAVSYTDISALKNKEHQVTHLLEEKEKLLQEVHHRIKNHMNTISSILALNVSYYKDPEITSVFSDIHNKVKIMQNIYNTLYKGENVDSVYLSSFINKLIRDLQSAYVYDQKLKFYTQIEDVCVSAKQSLPVGIIINELVTNSLKYAFTDIQAGTIEVAIHKGDDNKLYIHVSDNGIGIPEEIIRQRTYGFGLTLVDGYTTQFDGEMSIQNQVGTSINVTLKLDPVRTAQKVS